MPSQIKDKPRFLALDDARPFVAKFFFPGIMLFGSALILRSATRPGGILLGLIVGFVGLSYLAITGLVKPEAKCLYYRRFLRWRQYEYEEMVKCGRSIFLPLCYIKLKHFEPPFGKLYFILYNPVEWMWQQPKLDDETMAYIRTRISKPAALPADEQKLRATEPADTLKGRLARCAYSVLSSAGLVLFARLALGWPGQDFPPALRPDQGWFWRVNVYWWRFSGHVLDWPYNLTSVLCLVAGMLILRFSRWATALGLVLGAILGGLLARFFAG